MKKTLSVVLLTFALAGWTVAQTSTSGNNQTSGTNQTGTNQTNDSVQIVGSPTVTTTENSATIRWKTDKLAATSVKYGTSAGNMDQESRHSGGSRDHNVTLDQLQPNTTYHYAILDNDGQTRQSGQFTTKGSSSASGSNGSTNVSGNNNSGSTSGSGSTNSGSTSATNDDVQILEGPEVVNVSGDSATLWWRTNNVAATDVKYGTDRNNLSERAYEPGGDRQHDVQLTGLQPNTTYYYAIMTRDGQKRHEGEFRTNSSGSTSAGNNNNSGNTNNPSNAAGGNVFINQGPFVEYVDDDGAVIFWSTNMKSSSTVRYGTDQNNLTQTAQGAWGDKRHRVKITGLQPNTTYYFQVESSPTESGGQVAKSSSSTFETVAPGAEARRYNRRGWTR